jgi:hypothetical protein
MKLYYLEGNAFTKLWTVMIAHYLIYGCKRGGLRLPAPRPHEPHDLLWADTAARVPPQLLCGRCGSLLDATSNMKPAHQANQMKHGVYHAIS